MKFFRGLKRLRTDQSGMTLIDLAVAMAVLGLMLVPALEVYKQWKIEQYVGETSANRRAINKAIDDFYFENGFYPCPADPALGPGAANYGNADCVTTVMAGGIMIGAVPFATLKIPTEMSLDGWHNKFRYAVTQSQTTAGTFSATGGVIDIWRFWQLPNLECDTVTPRNISESTVHYALISHGPNGVGARTAEGTLVQACPGGGATLEAENCDDDPIFFLDVCAANDNTASADYYDDFFDSQSYRISVPTRLWTYSPADADDIFSNIEFVGVNNPNPQTNLDVVGNIRAASNSTAQICDENGANCFPSYLIAGYDTAMDCSDNVGSRGMTGVSNGAVGCNIGYSVSSGTCDTAAGEYVAGIDASGNIICGGP